MITYLISPSFPTNVNDLNRFTKQLFILFSFPQSHQKFLEVEWVLSPFALPFVCLLFYDEYSDIAFYCKFLYILFQASLNDSNSNEWSSELCWYEFEFICFFRVNARGTSLPCMHLLICNIYGTLCEFIVSYQSYFFLLGTPFVPITLFYYFLERIKRKVILY